MVRSPTGEARVEMPTLVRNVWYYVNAVLLIAPLAALPIMAMAAALFYQGRWVAHAGGAACALFAFSAVVRARLTRPKVGPVEIGADFVRARGITLPRATLSALVLPRPHGLFDLELRAPGKPRLLLRCRSLPEATHWMTALGLDPRARTASIAGYTLRPGFVWGLRVARVFLVIATAVLARSPAASVALVTGLAVLATFVLPRVMRRGSITVGADGVVTRDLLGARFIRWADVSALHPLRDRSVLRMKTGRTIELSASKTVRIDYADDTNAQAALGIRLSDAFSANVRAREEKPRLAHLIARSGREVGAWASSLAELTRTTFRELAVQPEDLEHLLEDPSAEPDVRIGAAVALKNLRVDADRLRVLARGSASPVVSSALERLAAGEAEAVVLEQLQASEPQRVD